MTNEDRDQIASRLYELATVSNLPPDNAKRHLSELLDKAFVVVKIEAYEEAIKAICGGCKRKWPSQIETHNGNNQSGTQLWHVSPSGAKMRCHAAAIHALKDSLLKEEVNA